MHFGPITGTQAPYVVRVTSDPSSFDPVSGYKINKHQRFLDFYNEYSSLKAVRVVSLGRFENSEVGQDIVECQSFKVCRASVNKDDAIVLYDKRCGAEIPPTYISFQRTLRLPEDRESEDGLPVQLGPLPLFSISSHASSLSKEMVRMGGLFLPMFQREALSICFGGDGPMARNPEIKAERWIGQNDCSENYGVRIYAGAINVISGRQGNSEEKDSMQDFVVIPKQERVDGFCVANGLVKQFVAMPLDKGYSVEQQLSSQEYIGGMQLEIAPRYKTSVLFARAKASEGSVKCPNDEALDSPQDLFLTPSEAGFLPGQLLLMQPLERDWMQPTGQLKFNPKDFPEKEFFGTAPQRDNHNFQYGRPTFLRELMAWCAPDIASGDYKLEAISPIPVPITWERLTSWEPPSSLGRPSSCGSSPVYPSIHSPGTATICLSPFLDIRCITLSLLRQEGRVQHVSNIPNGIDIIVPAKPFKEPKPHYMPLYSLAKDEIALELISVGDAGGGPFRDRKSVV